ncbi:MAG: DUF4145 domain-containing protein [Candidatus Limiplasma sp.]|nr:DUF4145 domain-containing protein [Candidatus Limiplasma sp.]
MIEIDFPSKTYVCPFCGHKQAFFSSYSTVQNGSFANHNQIPKQFQESSFIIYTILCCNKSCGRIAVVAINRTSHEQIDLVPQIAIKYYPNYIPEQIRKDYEEACLILERSPKAAATLLRRCLQGMIHDFWNIREKNLNAEISQLKNKVAPLQWKAIDGLRKIGNIGAHMEKDVNLIIDIDPDEAKKLLRLIEMLLEKWYITRHEEEALLCEIVGIAENKEEQRK